MSEAPLFTVFTPTFNRAHTLPVVWESLCAQTLQDFEWLLVDDGSDDGTEVLVRAWARQAPFAVRYVRQENQGKHVAYDLALAEARGAMFVPLDSDDACVPTALERLAHHWAMIPSEVREGFVGVTCLCQDEQGRVIGGGFDRPWFDSDAREVFYRLGYRGELWGAGRTDVLRKFPFGVPVRGTYVPESLVWFRIARHYRARYINEALRIYRVTPGSLMATKPSAHRALGAVIVAQTTLNEDLDYLRYAPWEFFRIAANYVRFSTHAGLGWSAQRAPLGRQAALVLHAIAYPVGRALAWRDGRRG